MTFVTYRPMASAWPHESATSEAARPVDARATAGSDGDTWDPRVSFAEVPDSFHFEAELPGLAATDFAIEVLGDTLTLKGRKPAETSAPGERVIRAERAAGNFLRSFRLPASVAADKVTAELRHGVLRVTLPKADRERKRTIAINAG